MKKGFLIFSIILATALMADAARFTNEMRDNFFSPANRTVKVGDTIRWVNTGNGSHNTVSAASPANGGWNSGPASRPHVFEFTFTRTGSFPYVCQPHAGIGMTGTITVQAADNTPPTVTITEPANNQTFDAPANFTVQASATDTSPGTVTNVQFFVGTTSIGNDTSSPYSAQASNIAAGTHSIQAVASDNNGARATNTISITVNPPANVPPVITINSPTNGQSYVLPATATLDASITDSDGTVMLIELFINGAPAGSTNTGGSVKRDFPIPSVGTFTLTIIAADNEGFKATNSVSITATAGTGGTPPQISNLQKTTDGKIRFLVDNVSTNQNATVQGKGDLNGAFLTITNVKGGTIFEETIMRTTNRFYRLGVTNAP